MRNRRNYYRILHVQPDAPAEMIRACYRTLMLRLRQHPDLGGDHWNAALINEAFATLGDRARRAAYDRTLADPAGQRRSGAGRTPPSPSPAEPAGVKTVACAFCHTIHAAIDATRPSAQCATCGSPLFAVVSIRPDGTARRALERVPRRMPVEICVVWPQPTPFRATCEDISINGMLIASDTDFAPGEHLRIACDFCVAVGVVRHRRREAGAPRPRWRIGVTFLTLRVPRRRGTLVSVEA